MKAEDEENILDDMFGEKHENDEEYIKWYFARNVRRPLTQEELYQEELEKQVYICVFV